MAAYPDRIRLPRGKHIHAAKPTGVCPVCGKSRALRKNGTLWNHGICQGAGQPPKEQ